MRGLATTLGLALGATSAACGGASRAERSWLVEGGSAGSGESGASATGGRGNTGTGGAPGSGELLTPSGYPRCGALVPAQANACDRLDKVIPLNPDVSAFTDGSIEQGELAPASVWVKNTDDRNHDNVCVGVTVNIPGIALPTDPDQTNPTPAHALPAGYTPILVPAYLQVGFDVEPGTVAHFTFWTTYQGTDCLGPTVQVDALVRASPFQ